jgi:hypothetical protein
MAVSTKRCMDSSGGGDFLGSPTRKSEAKREAAILIVPRQGCNTLAAVVVMSGTRSDERGWRYELVGSVHDADMDAASLAVATLVLPSGLCVRCVSTG